MTNGSMQTLRRNNDAIDFGKFHSDVSSAAVSHNRRALLI